MGMIVLNWVMKFNHILEMFASIISSAFVFPSLIQEGKYYNSQKYNFMCYEWKWNWSETIVPNFNC